MPDWVIIFVSVLNVTFTMVSIIAAISSGRSAQKSLDHEKQLDSFRLKASTSVGFIGGANGMTKSVFSATVGNVGSKPIKITGIMFEVKGADGGNLYVPRPFRSDIPKHLLVGEAAEVIIFLDELVEGLDSLGDDFTTVRARFSDALGEYYFSDWHKLR